MNPQRRQVKWKSLEEDAGEGERAGSARVHALPGLVLVATLIVTAPAFAQQTVDFFPDSIPSRDGAVVVNFVELARVPDYNGNKRAPPRLMHVAADPGASRVFVVTMRGPIYTISDDGRTVIEYLDVGAAEWGIHVSHNAREKGVQSLALHPQFHRPGAPGFGKLYVWTDTDDTAPPADFSPWGGEDDHDTVLLEWTASDPAAPTYDGGPPREVLRLEQPFRWHNGGQIGFKPLASPGDDDFGLLYVGVADGGRVGDPLRLAQNLASPFGKVLRIDPLGSNGRNGEYGIPDSNPFAGDDVDVTLGEIYAYGVRNPQRFAWDPRSGDMLLTDIGQGNVEELNVVTPGANLGWNVWEGSFRFRRTDLSPPRSDPSVTFPVAEYGRHDPIFEEVGRVAVTGVVVYRDDEIPELTNRVIFGDIPSGELLYVDADELPDGGQGEIRRILLDDEGTVKTLLQVIQETTAEQGRPIAQRADLRLGEGLAGRVLILNKQDGIVRLLIP